MRLLTFTEFRPALPESKLGGGFKWIPESRRETKVPDTSITHFQRLEIDSPQPAGPSIKVKITRLLLLGGSSVDVLESLEKVTAMFEGESTK